jgi:hypothetical protein
MTFRDATDRVLGLITLDEIAKALGVSRQLVAQARLETVNRRNPPEGWARTLRQLARARAAELRAQAAELERLAEDLGKGDER